MIDTKDLMLGNWVQAIRPDINGKFVLIESISDDRINMDFRPFNITELNPIPLTEDILMNNCGFGVVTENSAGKRYAYLNDGVYDSDLWLTYWETTKNKGKFFRRDIEFKYLHELQNLFKILTKQELEVKL